MIMSEYLTVLSKFDNGDFMGSFSVHYNGKTYDSWDNCIQKRYNLTMDEFRLLEAVVLTNVENTLKMLRPEEFKG